MRYNINMDSLEEKGSFLRKMANDEISRKIKELEKLKDELEWSGPAYDSFCVRYSKAISNLKSLTKTVDKLGYYMEYASGKYENTDEQVHKEYKKYENEAEVSNVKIYDEYEEEE